MPYPSAILFVYPSRTLGGVELLFYRLSKYLSQIGLMRIGVVDYPDGYLATELSDSSVEIIPHVPSLKADVTAYSHIVAPASHFAWIERNLITSESTRLLLWFTHPFNVLGTLPGGNRLYKIPLPLLRRVVRLYGPEYILLKRILCEIYASNGVVYMDYENVEVNHLLFDLPASLERFLPICVDTVEVSNVLPKHGDSSLHIGWVGRLTDFKMPALRYIISRADEYAETYRTKIVIHIIGSGEQEHLLPQISRVELRRLGTLPNSELAQYLVENCSVVFAMGTSALESAQLGLPTVLMDASYTLYPHNYGFRWLQETEGFVLGRFLRSRMDVSGLNFSQVIREAYQNPEVGSCGREYVLKNHSIAAVAQKLIEYLSTTKAHTGWARTTGWRRSLQYLKNLGAE